MTVIVSRITYLIGGGGAPAWTNMPAAVTVFYGLPEMGTFLANLEEMTHVRLALNRGVIGASGSEVAVQYWDGSAWQYLDGASGPSVPLDGSASVQTGYVALTAGARTLVWCRVVGRNGNGVADPDFQLTIVFGQIVGTAHRHGTIILSRGYTSKVWTNQPAADTVNPEYNISLNLPINPGVDLRLFSYVNFSMYIKTAGAVGAQFSVKYNTTFPGIPSYLGPLVSIPVSSAGMISSGWVAIPSGANHPCTFALYGSGGNGVADPAYGYATLLLKS